MKFYHYWRSSAAYRVRIGLSLKDVTVEQIPIELREGKQHESSYRTVNPAGLVPSLETDEGLLRQSMAILEYLDERFPTPAFLPKTPLARAEVRALCQDIGCDIHPLNNLRVLKRLRSQFDASEAAVNDWYRHWIKTGLDALETLSERHGSGQWFYHDQLSMVDVLLVPQMYNAVRYDIPIDAWPRLQRIYQHATAQPAFARAAPERNQPAD
ncbi:maleylacetoacetate isomerase [Saccharospirillum mangrovi]|uniref:maleylacetoacetate isomerase n=1 Tax=Saccharospirillum mangrovi TaxID=2161747 RepID=UPI000D3A7173|nr:maleylacetoacetate isomerase [Saccharospirillum mangrovi]